MRITAIVLAAGEGRRMGGSKALLPIGETTFLDHACRLFLDAGLEAIAVLGAQADRVAREARLPSDVRTVVNRDWRDGMLSSVWRGLDAAEALGADAVLLHPVDHPLVEPTTIRRVAEALVAGAAIAVPVWEARRGHPGGFARTVFAEIRSASLLEGARAVLAAQPGRVVGVLGDAGCVRGIDRPDQYRQWLPDGSHGTGASPARSK